MNDHVLDSSVVLAFLFGEDGAEQARPLLREAHISALNYSEVIQKALSRDVLLSSALSWIGLLHLDVHNFGRADAVEVACLRKDTADLGLSLGDRACLALARKLAVPVYTADRVWAELDIDIDVRLIR